MEPAERHRPARHSLCWRELSADTSKKTKRVFRAGVCKQAKLHCIKGLLTNLSWFVRFKAKKAANLTGSRMNNASTHEIVRIGVHSLQELKSKGADFLTRSRVIHRQGCLEDLLALLLWSINRTEIFNQKYFLQITLFFDLVSAGCGPQAFAEWETGRRYRVCKITYPERFFHRAKNDSAFISVASKNLLVVTGRDTSNLCGIPECINDTTRTGRSSGSPAASTLISCWTCAPASTTDSTGFA